MNFILKRAKNQFTGKDLELGKTEGRRRRGQQRWDGWMASLTQWTWVRANSGRQWRTGKPGELQSMGSQSQTRLTGWTRATSVLKSEARDKLPAVCFQAGGSGSCVLTCAPWGGWWTGPPLSTWASFSAFHSAGQPGTCLRGCLCCGVPTKHGCWWPGTTLRFFVEPQTHR